MSVATSMRLHNALVDNKKLRRKIHQLENRGRKMPEQHYKVLRCRRLWFVWWPRYRAVDGRAS